MDESVRHLAKLASDIWQIHPFYEGNTRATAIFMIKYMKTFGFKVNNDAFEKTSYLSQFQQWGTAILSSFSFDPAECPILVERILLHGLFTEFQSFPDCPISPIQ